MVEITWSEKDIEDFLQDHCEKLIGLKFIKRQHRTPVGIIDIIAKHPSNKAVYYVVELKKGCLDPFAYTQVLTYTKWMNCEESKNGSRVFVPFMIGNSLHADLSHLCDYFETEEMEYYKKNEDVRDLERIHKPQYRCFAFDPLSGVSFTYQSADERDSYENFSHMNDLYEDFSVKMYFDSERLAHG